MTQVPSAGRLENTAVIVGPRGPMESPEAVDGEEEEDEVDIESASDEVEEDNRRTVGRGGV